MICGYSDPQRGNFSFLAAIVGIAAFREHDNQPKRFSYIISRKLRYENPPFSEINTKIWYYWAQSLNRQAQMKNTSVSLGEHFDRYIAEQLASGRYRSASEVIREGLRLLEQRETKLAALKAALVEGERSGFTDYSLESLIEELDARLSS